MGLEIRELGKLVWPLFLLKELRCSLTNNLIYSARNETVGTSSLYFNQIEKMPGVTSLEYQA